MITLISLLALAQEPAPTPSVRIPQYFFQADEDINVVEVFARHRQVDTTSLDTTDGISFDTDVYNDIVQSQWDYGLRLTRGILSWFQVGLEISGTDFSDDRTISTQIKENNGGLRSESNFKLSDRISELKELAVQAQVTGVKEGKRLYAGMRVAKGLVEGLANSRLLDPFFHINFAVTPMLGASIDLGSFSLGSKLSYEMRDQREVDLQSPKSTARIKGGNTFRAELFGEASNWSWQPGLVVAYVRPLKSRYAVTLPGGSYGSDLTVDGLTLAQARIYFKLPFVFSDVDLIPEGTFNHLLSTSVNGATWSDYTDWTVAANIRYEFSDPF